MTRTSSPSRRVVFDDNDDSNDKAHKKREFMFLCSFSFLIVMIMFQFWIQENPDVVVASSNERY